MSAALYVIATARDEADRIGATLQAIATALPQAGVFVADDGSRDRTAVLAREHRASVVSTERTVGKGGAATAAAREALLRAESAADGSGGEALFLFCDADLGDSAASLGALVESVARGEADMAIASFRKRIGGGFGIALGVARWAIRRRCGYEAGAPLSGQRALRADVLRDALPFARGFGMEVGMTIDAVRAGHRLVELELDLTHRPTMRTRAGFAHRARQLLDVMRAYGARR